MKAQCGSCDASTGPEYTDEMDRDLVLRLLTNGIQNCANEAQLQENRTAQHSKLFKGKKHFTL